MFHIVETGHSLGDQLDRSHAALNIEADSYRRPLVGVVHIAVAAFAQSRHRDVADASRGGSRNTALLGQINGSLADPAANANRIVFGWSAAQIHPERPG